MITDANDLPNGHLVNTDICIIGAGVAGITLAREFANSDLQLTLLESGGLSHEPAVQTLYEGEYNARDYRFDLTTSRLRYFGGTSNHWAGNCMTLQDADFEQRDWVQHSGWPIRKSELTDYYHQAAKICELGRYQLDAYNNPGILPGPLTPYDNKRLWQDVMQSSPPTRFGTRYREDIMQADNILTLLHANVIDIRPNEAATSVHELSVVNDVGKKFVVKARYYILACGGIENARLLLHANQQHQNRLGRTPDLIGRFYMDHPFVWAGVFVETSGDSTTYFQRRKTNSGKYIRGVVGISPDMQRQHGIANSSIAITPLSYLAAKRVEELKELVDLDTDKQMHRLLTERPTGRIGRWLDRLRVRLGWRSSEPRLHLVFVRPEQVPNPDSRITLTNKLDRLGVPKVRVDWTLTEFDRRTMDKTLQIFAQETGRLGYGRIKNILGDEPVLPEKIRGGPHHMGTTRMHDDPEQGVVDRDSKLHGLDNFYIAGSSVFTTSGYAMPTLTIVALTLRLADHLKQKIR